MILILAKNIHYKKLTNHENCLEVVGFAVKSGLVMKWIFIIGREGVMTWPWDGGL